MSHATQPLPGVVAVPPIIRPGSGEGRNRAEWVLGNGLGGFAMGTVSGIPARRYHGWLIGAAKPPVARALALSSLAEWLVLLPGAAGGTQEQRIDLSSYRFSGATGGVVSPRGQESLSRFEKGPASVRWEYQFGMQRASRELIPVHGTNAVLIRYRIRTGGHAGRLELRPLVALRDFHGPLLDHHAAEGRYQITPRTGGLEVSADGHHLTVTVGGVASAGAFKPDPQWWYNFEYVREAERGLEAHEDLFNPGVLSVALPSFPAVRRGA
jgi:predicted glycogen debranching enzyme